MKKFLALALVLNSSVAFADTFEYRCVCSDNNNGDKKVAVTESEVVVTNLDSSYGDLGATFSAEFDPKYKPRPSPSKKLRYLGEEDGNARQVVIEEKMTMGSESGEMQIRGTEDGYWSSNFDCTLTQ